MANILVIGIAIILHVLNINGDPETRECYLANPCLCKFDDYKKIDLSDLFTEKSKFLEDDQNGERYFFHGCSDGNLKLEDYVPEIKNLNKTNSLNGSLIWYKPIFENNAYVVNSNNFKVLGYSKQIVYAEVVNDNGNFFELLYKEKDNITASFRLVCNNYDVPYIKVINAPKEFTLNSQHACVIELDHGMSTGSVLLLTLFFGFTLYFIAGGAMLYFLRGASGLELIPNIDFWRELPGLVKDGTLFVFSGCNVNYVSNAVYDRI